MAELCYKPSDHVLATDFDGESVLLHLAEGAYYGLDDVGTIVWEQLTQGSSLDAIVDVLYERYDAPRDRLRIDVERLLEELHRAELVTRA